MVILSELIIFQWDEGNRDKSFLKHGISTDECEEAFFDPGRRILENVLHSKMEDRFILLGNTKLSFLLYIVFTIRNGQVRIISARQTNKKEQQLYHQ